MRWHPDTCHCQFEVVDWDSDQATTLAACDLHIGLDHIDHFKTVYRGEVQIKEFALSDMRAEAPELFLTAAEVAALNRKALIGLGASDSVRRKGFLDALTDADVASEGKRLGATVLDAFTAVPGVILRHGFMPNPNGRARLFVIDCPQLSTPEKNKIAQKHARFGAGKVTLR